MASKSRKRRRVAARGKRRPAQRTSTAARASARERRRPRADDRPQAPWGSFPLVELVVLVALVLLVGGFVVSGTQGAVMVGTGLVLGSLAGLELSVREHFAGYRSHTLLLAGAAAVAVLAVLFFGGLLPPLARVAAAAAVFGLAAWWLTGAFRRRSGGYAFRVR